MTSQVLTIMALDTATTGCSVTVWRGGVVLAHDAREMSRGQAEVLVPMAVEVMRTAGVAPKDLRAIAITRGPGAFTGMRIGLAAARAFALALGIPCIGVTTLEAVAHGIAEDQRQGQIILAAVESKREDIYVQIFDENLTPLCDATAADGPALAALLDQAKTVLVVGDAAGRAKEMLAEHDIAVHISTAPMLPDTRIVAEIAVGRFAQDKTAPPPEPLYLRPPDAKLPKNAGRARP